MMNFTVQIISAILVIVTVIETTEAWRDGRKWRQRRIAHVFGKRNGADSNIDLSPLDGAESNIDLPSLNSVKSDILRSYLLSRNDQFSALNQDEKSKEDYDQKYTTDADHIPQSVIDRYICFVQNWLYTTHTQKMNYIPSPVHGGVSRFFVHLLIFDLGFEPLKGFSLADPERGGGRGSSPPPLDFPKN